MVQKIFTATPNGYAAALVEVETEVSNGLPTTVIVGLPDTVVQESRERIRIAMRSTSYQYPSIRVSINLAPGDLPKIGSHFDLAICLSVLLAAELVKFEPKNKLFIGELALDGRVRSSSGVLSMVIAAREAGFEEVFVPVENTLEASLVSRVKVFGVENLNQLISHLLGVELITASKHALIEVEQAKTLVDFSDIVGQLQAKRALLIAASGFHNVKLTGAPGSGKTMLAKALAGILPPLLEQEMLETTNLYSLVGKLPQGLIKTRPFRAPHHTASSVALVGGGTRPKPGELSLAHNGVLFLDELPEFPRHVLEVMRQPLEDRTVTISRAHQTLTFPAKFILVTAQNPCHCGNYGDASLVCQCHPAEVIKYNKKISGPLLDRIDMHIQVPRLKYQELKINHESSSSEAMRVKVVAAREKQLVRFGKAQTNSEMTNQEIKEYCALDSDTEKLLEKAVDQYALSNRAISRILKVSRTIADLSSHDEITAEDLLESLQYRLNV